MVIYQKRLDYPNLKLHTDFGEKRMKVLDLFSGIGGFSLGLERADMTTVAFCEIEEYPRKVLKKHWPDVPIHRDILELEGAQYKGTVDLICGGFPCQDISLAGKGEGIRDGTRSGLWAEYKRLINEVKPSYAIIENVANLRSKGLVTVLQDLWEVGYDAEWNIIPAGGLGFPHLRERIWIVAYPHSSQCKRGSISSRIYEKISHLSHLRRGKDKPGVERALNGVPAQMDRLKCLGNAVIPIIPQIIGEAIMELEQQNAS